MALTQIDYTAPLVAALKNLLEEGRTSNGDFAVFDYEDELETEEGYKRLRGQFQDRPSIHLNIGVPDATATDSEATTYAETVPVELVCGVSNTRSLQMQKSEALNLARQAQRILAGTRHEFDITTNGTLIYDGVEPFINVKGASVYIASFHIDFIIGFSEV